MMQTLQEIKGDIKKNNPKIRGKILNKVAEQGLEEQREQQIKEWQNLIEQIPTDILLRQVLDNVWDDWVDAKNPLKQDFADDELRIFVMDLEKSCNNLEQLYLFEKVKRLGWFKA